LLQKWAKNAIFFGRKHDKQWTLCHFSEQNYDRPLHFRAWYPICISGSREYWGARHQQEVKLHPFRLSGPSFSTAKWTTT
jgi:hypothetical protein